MTKKDLLACMAQDGVKWFHFSLLPGGGANSGIRSMDAIVPNRDIDTKEAPGMQRHGGSFSMFGTNDLFFPKCCSAWVSHIGLTGGVIGKKIEMDNHNRV